ncbi:MAG: UvrB/UvrC motif-containing protein, partial [Verrucomicrobiota bacterium]
MPASAPTHLKAKVRALPDTPGVYLMKDRLGRIIYVGKAKSLKKRVSSYFQRGRARAILQPKIRALIGLIADFDTLGVKSEPEALLLEGKLIKQWRPRYNTDFTDDKRFLLVRVDLTEELPRFRLTRLRKDDRSRYFGPFAHSGLLRKTLAQLRRQFGILLADATPTRLPDGSWQLYDDVRDEIYGGEHTVTAETYRTRVAAACEFLEGRSREWLAALRAEMATAAAKQAFEKAAGLRDLVFALEETLRKTRRFERTDPTLPARDDVALHAVQEALGLDAPPRAMECFDISHISGTFVVASMVRFADGRPDKDQYRRFQIKSFVGNNDFRAMEEVVGRRYRRLAEERKPFPDLIVLDGGRGQVGAALKAFFALDLNPPPLIGLAKKEETV